MSALATPFISHQILNQPLKTTYNQPKVFGCEQKILFKNRILTHSKKIQQCMINFIFLRKICTRKRLLAPTLHLHNGSLKREDGRRMQTQGSCNEKLGQITTAYTHPSTPKQSRVSRDERQRMNNNPPHVYITKTESSECQKLRQKITF